MTASVWKDNKVVMVMSTNTQPSATGTVLRRQRDGSRIPVPCPESIIDYNWYMGGVDRGDQLRGYYNCRMKSRKFYKYIFYSSKCFHILQNLLLFTHLEHHQKVPLTVGTGAHRRLLYTSSSWSRWWCYPSSSSPTLSLQD